MNLTTKVRLFLELAEFDEKTCISKIVNVDSFVGKYNGLKFGNGGSWIRFDSPFAKKYKIVTVKDNGQKKLSWEPNLMEREMIDNEFKSLLQFRKKNGNSLRFIKIYGLNDNLSTSRVIRDDIRKIILESNCVVCGNSDVEVDHKNGLYNDPRVLNCKTQTLDDFQALCRHCNQQKRQSIISMKKSGKRYSATSIPHLKALGIDYWCGDDTYDKNDVNAMVGTYWYDPVIFMEKAIEKIFTLKIK